MFSCPMIGQCLSNCPIIGQCMSNCPMVGHWMSNCPIIGQCIFNCMMVRQCLSNCPIVGQCMSRCPMILLCISNCIKLSTMTTIYFTPAAHIKTQSCTQLCDCLVWTEQEFFIICDISSIVRQINKIRVYENVAKFHALFQHKNHCKIRGHGRAYRDSRLYCKRILVRFTGMFGTYLNCQCFKTGR